MEINTALAIFPERYSTHAMHNKVHAIHVGHVMITNTLQTLLQIHTHTQSIQSHTQINTIGLCNKTFCRICKI